MRSFLRLHQSGKARFMQGGSGLVLVNPDQIQAVFSVDEDGVGSYIYLTEVSGTALVALI